MPTPASPGPTPSTPSTPPATPAEGAPPPGSASAEVPEKKDATASTPQPPEAPKAEDKQEAPAEKPKEEEAPAPFTPKLPEGVKLDEKVLASFRDTVGHLLPEKAQALVDMHVQALQAVHAQVAEAREAEVAAWAKAVQEDKDMGGAKFDASMALAQRAMRQVGSPALVEFLEKTGMGNHPELVRLFVRVGRNLKEDSVAGTASADASGELTEEAFLRQRYPSMFKQP